MKSKISRILGVALTLVMVLTLAVAVAPSDTPKAEAAITKLQWSKVPLPKFNEAGNFVWTPSTNVKAIAVAPAGAVLFAATDYSATTAYGGKKYVNDIMKSSDGGYTWKLQAGFFTPYATDNTSVVDIAVSPEYSTDTTVFVATTKAVYQSVDGGKEFALMATAGGTNVWGATETIKDMDITLDSGGRLAVIVGTANTTGFTGDVYCYVPATTGLSWKVQRVNGSTAASPTKTKNVLAVAFSPNFANDEGIFAVTVSSAPKTEINASFGYTKDGGGWGTAVGPGEFLDHSAANITATRARIAFPDDFDVDSISSNIAFVGLSDASNDPSTMEGDVFKAIFQPTRSSTIDLNVRGVVSALNPTATNIWSIDVMGDSEAAYIAVGADFWSTGVTNYYWLSYYSTDSGATWVSAREKSPTGGTGTWTSNALTSGSGAACNVVISPEDGNVIFAATSGIGTAAVSRSADAGKSFNQISLIDYASTSGNYTVAVVKPVSPFLTSNTMRLSTYSVRTLGGASNYMGAIWQTKDGGATYERIWSYANPTATDRMVYLEVVGKTIWAIDKTRGKFFRSTDEGVSWPRQVTPKETPIGQYKIVDDTTIYTAHDNGGFWYTTNLGRPWTKPEESEMTGTPSGVTSTGDTIMVYSTSGKVFISSDKGKTFERLGVSDVATTEVKATFDDKYATNKFVYATVYGVKGGGVYRCAVNVDDPGASEWKRIDNLTAASAAASANVTPNLATALFDVLYVIDSSAASLNDQAGGVWRSVNHREDTEGIFPPEFALENNGLSAGDKIGLNGGGAYPNMLFCVNSLSTGTNYYDQLLVFTDSLSSPVTLSSPAKDATGVGIRLSTTDLTMTASFVWTAVAGATYYQLQIADDEKFNSVRVNVENFEGQVREVTRIIPGATAYWRVRVTEPLKSPWSEVRKFKAAGALMLGAVELQAPAQGVADVRIVPTFSWGAVGGAVSYDFQIALDSAFTVPGWTAAGLTTNAYLAEHELDYNTTYYWRVRAMLTAKPATYTDYAVGIFTTMAEPVPPTPPVVIPPAQPPTVIEVPVQAAIPSYLLWVIVGIGAVLVIALIVLIVRTRRIT